MMHVFDTSVDVGQQISDMACLGPVLVVDSYSDHALGFVEEVRSLCGPQRDRVLDGALIEHISRAVVRGCVGLLTQVFVLGGAEMYLWLQLSR